MAHPFTARVCLHFQARIKVEVKPEEITPENIVRHRLASIGHDTLDINVPRNILETTTNRRIMSRIWGGNTRSRFPKINKGFTHGLDDFMYANLLYDPHAPRRPGSPGLIFQFKDEGQEWPKIMRLIIRLRGNVWQYMGQYKLTAAPPLTPVEWRAQSIKVKLTLPVRDDRENPHRDTTNVSRSSERGQSGFRKVNWVVT